MTTNSAQYTEPERPEQPNLTPRETDVLRLLSKGDSTAEMAVRLGLSHATVKTHLANTYKKLRVPNRAAAVARALRLGLIE